MILILATLNASVQPQPVFFLGANGNGREPFLSGSFWPCEALSRSWMIAPTVWPLEVSDTMAYYTDATIPDILFANLSTLLLIDSFCFSKSNITYCV
jgi:hypothetical protein